MASKHVSELTEADLNAVGKSRRPKSPDAGRMDPRLRRIRVMKMLELKLAHNYTRREIGQEMNLSLVTVDKELSWAKRANIFAELEDRILDELAPAAAKRLLREVQNPDGTENMDGDPQVALKLMDLAGFGRKDKKEGNDSRTDTLESYIARKRHLAGLRDNSIDGELLGDGVAQLEPGISGYLPPAPPQSDAPVGIPIGQRNDASAPAPTSSDRDGEADDVDGDDTADGPTAAGS